MPLYRKQFAALLILTLFLTSCGGSTEPDQDVNALMTASVGTIVASFFGTQTAMYTPASPTSTVTQTRFPSPTSATSVFLPGSPTNTFIYYSPTSGTITATGTLSTATINPGSLAVGCNNLAFIRDVNLPAGTIVQPSQELTKTWKVQNNGTCNWMYQYSLVLLNGDSFGASITKIQKLVVPGNWSELSIYITAPKKPGTYTSYWRLSNEQGMFGASLVVSFVVASPTSVPPIAAPPSTSTFTPLPTSIPSDTPTP